MGREDRRMFYSCLEVSRKLSNPQCVGRLPFGQLGQTKDGGPKKSGPTFCVRSQRENYSERTKGDHGKRGRTGYTGSRRQGPTED